MSIADKSLTIDVWGGITSLSLIQGESNGRKLVYTITDKNEPLDLTGKSVQLFVVKPDGKVVYTDCTVETAAEGKVSFIVSSQMVVVAGLGSGEFHIKNADDDLLKTPKIGIMIEPSHNVDEAVESSNELVTVAGIRRDRSVTTKEAREYGITLDLADEQGQPSASKNEELAQSRQAEKKK